MKKFTKLMLATAAVTAVSVAMAVSALADGTITGTYNPEDGVVTLKGVESSGEQQTLLVLSEDTDVTDGNAGDIIKQIDQDASITTFKLKPGLTEGTYYIRMGGSNGTMQEGTLEIGGGSGGDVETVTVIFGDSDRSGILNGTDSTMLARAIVNSTKKKGIAGQTFTIDGSALIFGDSDKSGILNGTDSTMLARAIVNSTKKKGIAGTEVQIPQSELQ